MMSHNDPIVIEFPENPSYQLGTERFNFMLFSKSVAQHAAPQVSYAQDLPTWKQVDLESRFRQVQHMPSDTAARVQRKRSATAHVMKSLDEAAARHLETIVHELNQQPAQKSLKPKPHSIADELCHFAFSHAL